MKTIYIKRLGLAVLAALGISLGYVLWPTGRVVHGVRLEGQALSGMNQQELEDYIETNIPNQAKTITIMTDQGDEILSLADLGLRPDPEETSQAIMDYGYESNWPDYVWHRFKALVYPQDYALQYHVDQVKAHAKLEAIIKKHSKEAHDAYLSLDGQGQVQLHKEENGSRIDLDKALEDLVKKAHSGQLDSLLLSSQEVKDHAVTADQLSGLTMVLASYETQFNRDDSQRTHNIELASHKINAYLLGPGATFSFNEVVGERTAEAGFDDAPVMVDGKLVPGIGGGICQVSSTLFNTALLSGMEILERTPHYRPVGYIPKGRDATVAWGYLDFSFKNPYSHPVYILSSMEGNSLTIYMIGYPEDKPQKVWVEVGPDHILPHGSQTRLDPNQVGDKIEEGSDGLQLITKRHIITSGGQARTDAFESIYDPQDTIIIKGRSQ